MQNLINKETAMRVRYCFTLSAKFIPEAILEQDKELQRVIRKSDQCFALVERRVDWDCYRVRIAAQQNYLHDKERSHVIFVSAMQLRGQEGSFQGTQCHTKKDVLKP